MQYAFTYTDNNRQKMKEFQELLSLVSYLKKQGLVEQFVSYADKHGLKRRNLMVRKSYTLLDRYINGRVIYNMLDEQALTQYLNQDDPVIHSALKVFKNNASFPKAPAKTTKGKK